MSVLLAAALQYAREGRRVLPLHGVAEGHCSCGGCHTPGKHPRINDWPRKATTDEATIRRWWEMWPKSNIGIATGDGLGVLDMDTRHGGDLTLAKHDALPQTAEVASGGGGKHFYFRIPAGTRSGDLALGLELKAAGSLVVAPPSIHESGKEYVWLDRRPLADAPTWLLANSNHRRNGAAPPLANKLRRGNRNRALTSYAGRMRRAGASEEAIASALLVENETRSEPPLEPAEVYKIAASIGRRYQPEDSVFEPGSERVIKTSPVAEEVEELTGLLGLDRVGLHATGAQLFGRGSKASAWVHLSDGNKITLDPIGTCATVTKLPVEVALQAGAAPTLKGPDVTRVLVLLHRLAEHHDVLDADERALDHGTSYLQDAKLTLTVRMSDQIERWRAFERLGNTDPVSHARADGISIAATSIVLEDAESGVRYVRAGWFAAYVRQQGGPGAAEEAMHAMRRLGWMRPNKQGRVVATCPGRPARLSWAFFLVPPGWELQ